MGKKALTCDICRETTRQSDVFTIRVLDKRHVCDICLETVIAPVSPQLFSDYLKKGKIVYHDKAKKIMFDKKVSSVTADFDTWFSVKKVEEVSTNEDKALEFQMLKPKDIVAQLDKFVIGQDHAKKTVAVAAYNHFKRIKSGSAKKSNILMMGPTGVGKTYICTLLSKMLDAPFVIVDANSVTQAGYVGGDVEDILENLFIRSDMDLERAQKGIVLIDEIDKIAVAHTESGRDAAGKGVQEALLKIIEGGEFKVDVGSGQDKKTILFDTTNVLFIVSGAFPDLENIVKAGKGSNNKAFFGAESTDEEIETGDAYRAVTTQDLESFGLIPELIGRLPIRTVLNPLSEDDLVKIMVDTDDSVVKYYKESLLEDGVKLKVPKAALMAIAKLAVENRTGARGLQTVFETLLLDVMYEAPSKEGKSTFTLTKKLVENNKI